MPSQMTRGSRSALETRKSGKSSKYKFSEVPAAFKGQTEYEGYKYRNSLERDEYRFGEVLKRSESTRWRGPLSATDCERLFPKQPKQRSTSAVQFRPKRHADDIVVPSNAGKTFTHGPAAIPQRQPVVKARNHKQHGYAPAKHDLSTPEGWRTRQRADTLAKLEGRVRTQDFSWLPDVPPKVHKAIPEFKQKELDGTAEIERQYRDRKAKAKIAHKQKKPIKEFVNYVEAQQLRGELLARGQTRAETRDPSVSRRMAREQEHKAQGGEGQRTKSRLRGCCGVLSWLGWLS